MTLLGTSPLLTLPCTAEAAAPVAAAREIARFPDHHLLTRVAEVGSHTALFFGPSRQKAAKAVLSHDGGRSFSGAVTYGALDAAVFDGKLYTIRAGRSVRVQRHEGVRKDRKEVVWTANVPGYAPPTFANGTLAATEAGLTLMAFNGKGAQLIATSRDGEGWRAKKADFLARDIQLSYSNVFFFDPTDKVVAYADALALSGPKKLRHQENLSGWGTLESVRVAKDETLLFRRFGKRYLVFNFGFSPSMPPPKPLDLGFNTTGSSVARHGSEVHIVWADEGGSLYFIEQPLGEIETFRRKKRIRLRGLHGKLKQVQVSRRVPGRVYLGTDANRFYVANYLQAKSLRRRRR